MDPDENLREQLELAKLMHTHDDYGEALRLAELVRDLDEWIKKGGFLPAAWMKGTIMG